MRRMSPSVATSLPGTLILALSVHQASAQATSDTLSYELTEASVSTEPTRRGWPPN